jgi:hypothetical protein
MTRTHVTHCSSDAIVLVMVIVLVTYMSPYDSHMTSIVLVMSIVLVTLLFLCSI